MGRDPWKGIDACTVDRLWPEDGMVIDEGESEMVRELATRIVTDPTICGGRPIISGTRMRVTDVLDLLANGASRSDILVDYDYLTDADISAALSYAADAIDHRVIRAA